ncbi:cupin domain-containing protein [Asticcacaulis sp. ZE23SCel15]|uniref:cupin domain-containing protein n=1 Tax=Asticcacaulis sp. ZE23SCel15 TaxID=3059027 RepID=UPI00265FBFBC|nr:cupin domain-containing protein [Asticcacaulis sp. ZE23SCel15]WKL58524.1 cupin domain-containing protein [Asticcacaulis sp. ZE23SCel15]
MSQLLMFDRSALPEPEVGGPLPERIVSGNPQHLTWNLETSEDKTVFSGYWQSTPGSWRIAYDEWEFCILLEAASILHEDGGPSVTLTPGSQFVIRPGFTGIWEVVETTLKSYVIRL